MGENESIKGWPFPEDKINVAWEKPCLEYLPQNHGERVEKHPSREGIGLTVDGTALEGFLFLNGRSLFVK